MLRLAAVSDLHLGWEQSEGEAFRHFLANEAATFDWLLLLGDCYEMWRRDVAGVLIENRDVLDMLAEIRERGTRVVLIAGNHDAILMRMGTVRRYADPFIWRRTARLVDGATTYVFTHGNQFDPPTANEDLNVTMCLTNDDEGKAIADLHDKPPSGYFDWARRLDAIRGIGGRAMGVLPLKTLIRMDLESYFARPGLAGEETALRVVRSAAKRRRKRGEFLVHGHTHVPVLEKMYADTGSWVEGHREVFVVEAGEARLETYDY